ncbi:hypothetical protein DU472_02480 [Campylobacter novaezeelandiae]|uniref:Uncharacterized protein n=1 Tax=Campylobacter novaezeelandiae TaxID=2267891 RepID=A0A4Q9JVT6_9BACT|nr:hypothetical protein [Campylobacter novaezeelandiae]TBR81581.1 hypothetical protein DU472_02480 [Campylobacter novaezeelandiae]TBR82324.1 hypothetical protein DU473_00350 [Campylobacter novaezeelandiae]
MHQVFFIVLIAAILLLIFLSIIAYLIINDGKKNKKLKTSNNKVAKKTKVFDTDLDKMIATAKDASLSDEDLKALAQLFMSVHKLGSKKSKELDEATKKKLDFIAALSSNNSASPQTISFLNKELKKVSASYKKEIDAYEQMGLAKRKIKEDSGAS